MGELACFLDVLANAKLVIVPNGPKGSLWMSIYMQRMVQPLSLKIKMEIEFSC